MGADEFLNRRVNEELQRAFEAGIPSSEVYPLAEIYHIGTPSERLTSEAQIMQSQSAMSMLMMQMARKMNQRNLQQSLPQQQQQQVGQDPNQSQAVGQQGSQTGGYHKEMKMDEKWIPAMPVSEWKSWTLRGKELSGSRIG